ncbi:alpha/beta fold hydrolase [Streptomyces sp. FXJ1.172]|uniref:thioesterase II family protein n=1 Tax=Streptomyces sp. FXJ1.172 TaxID=710705 RepID=UPI0007CF9FB3|nr:alpha/beta fold hydrolase [Streptomyces sp. FXJ1.172]WEO93653.1 alpha/beta fold hydrolase [Streptomyces sp. FXJ1.172]
MGIDDVSSDVSLWLRRFEPADNAGSRLVCFPHAGGSAAFYLPMARALAPAVDVLAVQYPGRQDRRAEPCIDDIPSLADHVARALAGSLDRPLALFGHSMGALIAFEVARRLQRDRPGQPAHLFVSGRRAPTRYHEETYHLLDDDGIVAEIRSRGGTEARVLEDKELLEMVLPTIRGDYRAVGRYRYVAGDPLRCPVTAIVGDRDQQASVEEVMDWEKQAPEGGFEFKLFPGGHFFLVKEIAEVLAVVSDRIGPATGTGLRR